ncbi:MAG TPA: hypothetical protein VNE41_00080 [Chitinophagaceae bacterium]|nr:hypothetical protein [Chitinophagaceae bacterium]
MKHVLSIVALLFVCFGRGQAQKISLTEVNGYIGKYVTICGLVTGVIQDTRSTGSPTFIDIGNADRREQLTVLIWKEDQGNFSYPLRELMGGRICITGIIMQYRGRPEIVVKGPGQISKD